MKRTLLAMTLLVSSHAVFAQFALTGTATLEKRVDQLTAENKKLENLQQQIDELKKALQ
jgi:hypothetical protein